MAFLFGAGAAGGGAGAGAGLGGSAGAAYSAAPAAAGAGVTAPAVGATGGAFAPGLGLPAGGGVLANPATGFSAAGQAVPLGFPTAANPGLFGNIGNALGDFGHGFWNAYSQPLQQMRAMLTGGQPPAMTPPSSTAGRLGQMAGQRIQPLQASGGGGQPQQAQDAGQMLALIQAMNRRRR